MLTCTCSYADYDDALWYWTTPQDLRPLATSRRKRCKSCGMLIDVGAECLQFPRHRNPRDEIEESIYGIEVPLASYYHCQRCGEIFLNLNDAGFCLDIESDMREDLKEYWELTGFDPGKYGQMEANNEQA